MAQKIKIAVLLSALMAVGIAPRVLRAQVSLEEQLKAQYTLSKVGSDSSGYSVVQEGTLLVVKKGGILGVPYKNVATRVATYKDGTVHSSDPTSGATAGLAKMGCGLLHKCPSTPDALQGEKTTKLFKVNDKVYAEKLSVNMAKDQVTFGIVSCDTCNNVDPPTYNKSQVVFQFAAGSLATTGASQVEDTIAQVLAIDDSGGDQGNNGQGGNGNGNSGGNNNNDQQQGGNQGGGGGGQGQSAQADPTPVQIGQTIDQVKNAWGNPEKIVNLGVKQIYVYKDLKVTFIGGKVADVQ